MVGYITKLTKEKNQIYISVFFCEWGWVYFCKLANVLFWQIFTTQQRKKKKEKKKNEDAKGTKGLFLGGRKQAQFAIL